MRKLKYITTVFSIVFINKALLAQNKNINVITSAVPFLQIATDARAGGMGNTSIAASPDVNAVYWNIGKLPFSKSKGAVSANYSPWLKEWTNDMYLASLAGYFKVSDNEAMHAQIKYFNPGDLQFTDNNGNHLQSYHPNEFAVDLGYSRKLSNRTGLGIGIKYIRSDLAKGTLDGQNYKAGNALAADVGLYYDLRKSNEEGWSFGTQLSNLGSKISYTESTIQKDFLPANLGLGAAYTKVFDEQNTISFGFDVNKLLVPTVPSDSAGIVQYKNKSVVSSWFSSFSNFSVKQFQMSIGAEYWYNNKFALRAGYFYEDKTKGDRKYFSAGASVNYNVLTAHFSYLVPTSNSLTKNPLTNTVQFGVNINLDK